MGTTIKQINNIKIKLAIDGTYHLYHAKENKGFCIFESSSKEKSINYAKKYGKV